MVWPEGVRFCVLWLNWGVRGATSPFVLSLYIACYHKSLFLYIGLAASADWADEGR